jgi:hypothetical protein
MSHLSPRRAIQAAAAMLLLLSALAGFAAISIAQRASQIERESVGAVATVVGKQERRRARYVAGYRNSEVGYILAVSYRYVVAGQTLHGTQGVDRERFDALQVGQAIPVRYVAANPSVSEIDVGWTGRNAIWAGAACLGLGLLAGGLLLLLGRPPKREPA